MIEVKVVAEVVDNAVDNAEVRCKFWSSTSSLNTYHKRRLQFYSSDKEGGDPPNL